MDWLATGSCPAAEQFGWFVGTRSGLYLDVLAAVIYLSSRAFRIDAQRMVSDRRRLALQSLLRTLPWLLPIVWTFCAAHAEARSFHCYAVWLMLGASAVAAPVLILLMLSAANRVGGRSVRS